MREHASGFCIYDDPALAIALARRAGLRVLYLDFDVHHGDGVQAIHLDDPGVMTVSFHESGRFLFPGTGFVNELGWGTAAGTSVNVPFQPPTGERSWLAAVRMLVPALAAAFGPDVIVTQHGADSHACDPLAHMLVTTTAMGRGGPPRRRDRPPVCRRPMAVDGRRWLRRVSGGAPFVVAGLARRRPSRCARHPHPSDGANAGRTKRCSYHQAPLPETFDDPPNAALPVEEDQERAEVTSDATARLVRDIVVPRLLRVAIDERWWSPEAPAAQSDPRPTPSADVPSLEPTIVDNLTADQLERLDLAARVVPPADAADGRALLVAAVRGGARVTAAIADGMIVGAAVLTPARPHPSDVIPPWEVAALGIAPAVRGRRLASALLQTAVAGVQGDPVTATIGVAERDPVDPLPVETRTAIARRLLDQAGFRVRPAEGAVGQVDAAALTARHG